MNRLRELREDNDLKQEDVSRATGITQKTLSNYETGKTNPDSRSLILLADFYNVTIDYLVKRVDINLYSKSSRKNELNKCINMLNAIYQSLD